MGLGWIAAIITLNLTIKLFATPLQLISLKTTQKIQLLNPELTKSQGKQKEIFQKFKVKRYLPMLNILQLPFFITSMIVLRNKCFSDELNGFSVGGILWFKDLTISDP